jgi:hypothetical protein
MMLWKHGHRPRTGNDHGDIGLTRDQLAEYLVVEGKYSDPSQPLFKTIHAQNKHLAKLRKLKHRLLLTEKVAGSGVGQRKHIYSLAYGKAITWPTTAKIMLEVLDAPEQHVNHDPFVTRIEERRLRREPAGSDLSKAEIIGDIEYAIANHYLDRFQLEIRVAQRLRFEISYITAIANAVDDQGREVPA